MRVVVFMLLLAMGLQAEDIYVAQSSAGGDTGADVANAHSIAWLNTAGNWGAGAGKVSAGDTVYLSGTFTTELIIPGSGSAGSPVTLSFLSGAKFSKANWGDSAAAIQMTSQSYIILDGGANGIIENTDTGTGKTYHTASGDGSYGVNIVTSDHIEVKNLTIQNLYVRTAGTEETVAGIGVRIYDGQTNSVHNCTITFADVLIAVNYTPAATQSGISIYSNTLAHANHCISIGDTANNAITDGIEIYANTIQTYHDWDGSLLNSFHRNCVIAYATNGSGSRLRNLRIWGNTFGPETAQDTQITSYIFFESYVESPLVFNNLFLMNAAGTAPMNGFVYFKGQPGFTRAAKAFNNTFYCATKAGTGIETETAGDEVKNNVFVNVSYPVYAPNGHIWESIDYNCYFNFDGVGDVGGSFAWWQASAGSPDAHGMSANPLYVNAPSDCSLQSSSPAINTATNLASYFTTDYAGNTRTGAWDIGAYEYIPPARAANAVTVHVGTMTQPTP